MSCRMRTLDTIKDESILTPLMTSPPDLSKLSHAEKDTLILALFAQLAAAHERIAAQDARILALEARLDELTRPPKTPDNSSKPPSQGQKQDCPSPTGRAERKSRPGVGQRLHPNPDRRFDAMLPACPKCHGAFPEASQTPQQVYERIELPSIKPHLTQVRRFGGRCACCGEPVTAGAAEGLERGSPFGHTIAAMVVYLHYAHAIGMQRLALLMDELFALSISEGAISNILARARAPLLAAAATIQAAVLASPVVCSDETPARVKGKNGWEWVEPAKGSTDAQHRWKVGGGVCRHAGRAAHHPTQPRQSGGDSAVRRNQACRMGVRHAGEPAWPRHPLASMSGASAPRCGLRYRMRRYRVQRAFQATSAASHRHRTTAREAEGHHFGTVSL
jgi:hypothetical protein